MRSTAEEQVVPARRTRPRNRRAMILSVASDLFSSRGYPHVAMGDIARAVGIGASALYRHFRGKRDLLAEVVLEVFTASRRALEPADSGECTPLLRALAGAVLDQPMMGVLWQRESRHLATSARRRLNTELRAIAQLLTDIIRKERPELDAHQANLLSWSTLSALMSVAYNDIRLPRADYQELLTEMATDIIGTPLPPTADHEPRSETAGQPAQQTRELLLAAANRLFAERGYDAVGVEDIGAAVGIAGPALYHHFGSKVDLLLGAMNAASERISGGLVHILTETPNSAAALHALMRDYLHYSLERDSPVGLLATETGNLPESDRLRLHDVQRRYLAEWIRLLQDSSSIASAEEAQVRAQAVVTVINDVARSPRLRTTTSNIDAALDAIGVSLLHLVES
jgi:AcrR family transcriptional regulator